MIYIILTLILIIIILGCITLTSSFNGYMCYITDPDLSGSKLFSKIDQDHNIIIKNTVLLIISVYYLLSLIPLLFKKRKFNSDDKVKVFIDDDGTTYNITTYFYSYKHKSIMYNYGMYECIFEKNIHSVINNEYRNKQIKNILK